MEEIEHLLTTTDGLYVEYREKDGTTNLPINLPAILDIISNRTGLRIEFHQKAWNQKLIKGCLLRYGEHAVIQYSSELNTCWERFVICKEACHLLLDKKESFTKDPAALVDALVSANICSPDDHHTNDEISEYLAEIAALELLFPFSLRREVYNAYQDGMTIFKVANQFKLPAHYVEQSFSDAYRDKIDSIHYEVRNKAKAV